VVKNFVSNNNSNNSLIQTNISLLNKEIVPVTVNVSATINDILKIEEINHIFTLKEYKCGLE